MLRRSKSQFFKGRTPLKRATVATTKSATILSPKMTTKRPSPEPDRPGHSKRSKSPPSPLDGAFAQTLEENLPDFEQPTSGAVALQMSLPTLTCNSRNESGFVQLESSPFLVSDMSQDHATNDLPTVEALVEHFISTLLAYRIDRTNAGLIMQVIEKTFKKLITEEQYKDLHEFYNEFLNSSVPATSLDVYGGNDPLDRILIILPIWQEKYEIEMAKKDLPSKELERRRSFRRSDLRSLANREEHRPEPEGNIKPWDKGEDKLVHVCHTSNSENGYSVGSSRLPTNGKLSSPTKSQSMKPRIPQSLLTFYDDNIKPSISPQPSQYPNSLRKEYHLKSSWQPVQGSVFFEDDIDLNPFPHQLGFHSFSTLEPQESLNTFKSTSDLNPDMDPQGTNARVAAFALNVVSMHLKASDSGSVESMAVELESDHEIPKETASFTRLMDLPKELRDRIYMFVVGFDRPIQPHYCGSTEHGLRFHDDQCHETGDHDEIWSKLAITRASKQLRQESLPIFYSENKFEYGLDTRMYFQVLTSLGRFELVRGISFDIFFHHSKNHAQRVLKDIYDVLNLDSNSTISPLSKSVRDASMYAGIFLLLRKLSKTFTDDERTVALQVPAPEWFDELPGLTWFKEVAKGAGINVKLIQGGKLSGNEHSRIRVHWYHRYQKEGSDEKGVQDTVQKVLKNGFMEYPHLKTFDKNRTVFYRRNCRGGITWFEEI